VHIRSAIVFRIRLAPWILDFLCHYRLA
jgi:hypothetical protein